MQKVISNIASLDPYLQHGYVCVQKNDKFFSVADGILYDAAKPAKIGRNSAACNSLIEAVTGD